MVKQLLHCDVFDACIPRLGQLPNMSACSNSTATNAAGRQVIARAAARAGCLCHEVCSCRAAELDWRTVLHCGVRAALHGLPSGCCACHSLSPQIIKALACEGWQVIHPDCVRERLADRSHTHHCIVGHAKAVRQPQVATPALDWTLVRDGF